MTQDLRSSVSPLPASAAQRVAEWLVIGVMLGATLIGLALDLAASFASRL